MRKYICITNSLDELRPYKDNLTIGKLYTHSISKPLWTDSIMETNNISIKNDLGITGWYNKKYFKPIEEYRENKLNKLLE